MINYPFALPLALIFGLIALLILVVVSVKTTFRLQYKEKFSFRNRFPFEAYYQREQRIASYFRLALMLLLGLSLAVIVIFAIAFRSEVSNLVYAIAIGVFYILALVSSLVTFMLKPNYLSQFKIYVILSFAFALMAHAMLGILLVTNVFEHLAYKIVAGFAFALAVAVIVMMVNPKLKNWAKLNINKNADGTVSYERPKISPLAFSLWLNFLGLTLGELLMLVVLLLNALGL